MGSEMCIRDSNGAALDDGAWAFVDAAAAGVAADGAGSDGAGGAAGGARGAAGARAQATFPSVVVLRPLEFGGDAAVRRATRLGARAPDGGALAGTGGWYNTTIAAPARVFDQLAERAAAYPVAWTDFDLDATWLKARGQRAPPPPSPPRPPEKYARPLASSNARVPHLAL